MTINLNVTEKETYDRLFKRNKNKLEPCHVKRELNDDQKYRYYSISYRLTNHPAIILEKYYHGSWVYLAHEDLLNK